MNSSGEIISNRSVYDKWQGAHWILASLADIGYPAGDKCLLKTKEQILELWLSDFFYKEFTCERKEKCYQTEGVPLMQGKYRRCASQQGNALFFLTRLGLDDIRLDDLVERLLHWQWPDGGWNCDKNPDASHSSFAETLLPLRGLVAYGKVNPHKQINLACRHASEVFLRRHLYKRETTGKVIRKEFINLHYPLYWHYDVLAGLKVMAEGGFIMDKRCNDALDLLESKRLPDGGFPAEARYYKVSEKIQLGADYVDWGGTSKKQMNEWVTVDALYVLKAAGRIQV